MKVIIDENAKTMIYDIRTLGLVKVFDNKTGNTDETSIIDPIPIRLKNKLIAIISKITNRNN